MPDAPAETYSDLSHRLDRLARAAADDPGARARVVDEILPLLRRWSRRYAGRGVDTDDLVQDAVVGVLRALARYRPERGPFLPWARLWARQALQQAVAEGARPVRLPTHVLWDMHELKEQRERPVREILNSLFGAVRDHCGTAAHSDDMTAIMIKAAQS